MYNPANLTHIHPFSHRLLGFVITFFGIIIAMNIRKIVGMEGGVSDFQLEIAPKTLLLPKGARSFALYLEKGMQVLGRFQSEESSPLKEQFYRFRRVAPAAFYLNNLTHSHYAWSLYSVNLQSGEENLESSATFDLERTVRLYQMELLEKQRQIQTSIKEKNFGMKVVLEIWAKIKREMKTYRSNQKCVFANQNFEIQFQVEIRNALDFEAERWEEEKQRNQSPRVRADQEVVYYSSPESRPKKFKERLEKVIELQSQSYRTSNQDKQNNEINTKESITYEQEALHDGFKAVVKIMNPNGEEIDADRVIQLAQSGVFERNGKAIKKFSLLSDIIQMSCEGSSSYGQADRSSSNGAKTSPAQKEGTVDMVIQREEPTHEPFVLNKVKTLPYESHHKLQVRDGFRRAQTAEKNQSQSQQMHDQQAISITELPNTTTANFALSKPEATIPKWVFLVGIILLLVLLFSGSWSDGSKRRRRNKP